MVHYQCLASVVSRVMAALSAAADGGGCWEGDGERGVDAIGRIGRLVDLAERRVWKRSCCIFLW